MPVQQSARRVVAMAPFQDGRASYDSLQCRPVRIDSESMSYHFVSEKSSMNFEREKVIPEAHNSSVSKSRIAPTATLPRRWCDILFLCCKLCWWGPVLLGFP